MINNRLILALIPKSYWIVLIVGILFRFLGGEYLYLSNFILNCLLIMVFIKVGVIIHEAGHLIFAKIVKGQPRRMILGSGHEVVRFIILNTKIIINTPFRGGFSFATFKNQSFLKWKFLILVSGGLLSNLIFVLIIYKLFGLNWDSLFGTPRIDPATTFILSNLFIVILSLIPYRITHRGIKIPNDGLNILMLPFRKIDTIKGWINANDLLDAHEYFEAKNYDRAIEIYENYLKYDQTQIIVKINLSVMYLKKGNYTKSIEILENILGLLENKDNHGYKALVYNNLAWLHLLQKDIGQADRYSKVSIDLIPKEKIFQGTRGSVLVAKGNLEEGINVLINLVDFRFANNQTLAAAMFLRLAFHLKGDNKEELKYRDFVNSNIEKLDIDDKKIWKDINEKIEIKAE